MAACCVSMNITPECSQVVSYKSSSCIKTSTRIQLSYWACKRLLFQSDMTWYLSILLHRRYSFSSRRWPHLYYFLSTYLLLSQWICPALLGVLIIVRHSWQRSGDYMSIRSSVLSSPTFAFVFWSIASTRISVVQYRNLVLNS